MTRDDNIFQIYLVAGQATFPILLFLPSLYNNIQWYWTGLAKMAEYASVLLGLYSRSEHIGATLDNLSLVCKYCTWRPLATQKPSNDQRLCAAALTTDYKYTDSRHRWSMPIYEEGLSRTITLLTAQEEYFLDGLRGISKSSTTMKLYIKYNRIWTKGSIYGHFCVGEAGWWRYMKAGTARTEAAAARTWSARGKNRGHAISIYVLYIFIYVYDWQIRRLSHTPLLWDEWFNSGTTPENAAFASVNRSATIPKVKLPCIQKMQDEAT